MNRRRLVDRDSGRRQSMLNERLMDDKLHEECGVFGIYGHPQAVDLTYYGLHALQHRGQESAGIVAAAADKFTVHKDLGLVTDVFSGDKLNKLSGSNTVGHVRYTTAGKSIITDTQPLVFKYRLGTIALAQNGQLVNAHQIRRYLERQGSIFQTQSDTEVIAHLIARSSYDRIELALKEALSMIKGSYALLLLAQDKLIAALDPNGIRPLSYAQLEKGYSFSSETCAYDIIGAKFVRDVNPGEMIVVSPDGLHCCEFAHRVKKSVCSFEYIYFARPDSNINKISVHQSRKLLGKHLAEEKPVEADLVLGVPDSSLSAAIGYAEALGIPYELGLIKNRYVGRTFIQPKQELRTKGVKMKLSIVNKVVEGKRVVMVDDSIVRGTTSSRIVHMLRDAGAKEVHVRISSPPVAYSCFYGIDTSSREELIVTKKTIEQICQYIDADSLEFLSVPGLIKSISGEQKDHKLCLACFTGQYPTEIYPQDDEEDHNE